MNQGRHIFLIFHGRFPSEKAASLMVAKSADAFVGEGMDVTVLVPRRIGVAQEAPKQYYRLKNDLRVVYLPTIDFVWLGYMGRLAFWLAFATFSWSVYVYLLLCAKRNDIAYSNETLPSIIATLRCRTVCYELHDYPESFRWAYRVLFRRVSHILITNHVKLDRFKNEYSFAAAKAWCEPNAVDVDEFSIALPRTDARKKLGLPADAKIVAYTGHLYAWKGVDTLAMAAKNLPEALIYVVGGTDADVANFRDKWGAITNLRIVGHRPHEEMPLWQKAADVLVLPNTGKDAISRESTSPMKLFEYMASGTPIVASNIPSIAEIVYPDRAELVRADDPQALSEGIKQVLSGNERDIALGARAWVVDHTWEKRAARIKDKLS